MTNHFLLKDIAKQLGVQLIGSDDVSITAVSPIQSAGVHDICFFDDAKQLDALLKTQAGAVITSEKFSAHCPTNVLVTSKPRMVLAQLLRLMYPVKKPTKGLHPSAVLGSGCKVDPSASIGANVVIGNDVSVGKNTVIGAGTVLGEGCRLSEDCWVYPNVTLYQQVRVGARTIIHSGAVIGADGFSFDPDEKGQWHKLPQIGSVTIGEDVEIGANTTIDCGAIEDTMIGDGVKLDNLIMIAHNVQIGDNTVIAGSTAIAGSTKIGCNCIIAGACAIGDHVILADRVILSGTAMVTKSISKPGVYSSGTGLLPQRHWQKSAVRFRQLDDIYQRLRALEQK